jgi:hypothetical protein
MILKYTQQQSKDLLELLVHPFSLKKPYTWSDTTNGAAPATTPDTTPTTTDTGRMVCFEQGKTFDETKPMIKALLGSGGRGSMFTPDQMEQFMNYSASFFFRGDTLPAPRNRHKIHQLLGGVVSNGCNHEIECVGRFVGSKSFAKVWRNLGYGDLKTKMKKVLKEVSWRLKAMLPQVSDKEWTNMVQVSFIDDEILQSLFGRTVLLYSASTVKRIISKNAEDRVILQADHWQKDKKGKWMEKPLTGAMMPIAPQVAYILENEESYSSIFAPDQHHPRKFIVGATHSMLVFKIEVTMGGFQEEDANSITAESYNIAQQLNNICTKTPFKDVVSVCVPARARRHRGGDLDTTGHLKNMNMLLMYTTTGNSDMDKELIIQIDVPNGVWKAVMENTNQLTADELARPYMQQMNALVASPLEKEVAIGLEGYIPKPVLNVDIQIGRAHV